MTKATCPRLPLVDAHFDGTISVAQESELRHHLLEGCPVCQFRYTRLAMVAKMHPEARRPEDRIGAGLGFGGAGRPWRGWAILLGAVAACAVLVIVLLGRRDEQRFAARGPANASGELRVFRVKPGAAAKPVSGRIAAADELAFAYRNATGKKHLFIFGVDEHRHVYWFSPPWRSASEQPAAPMAAADGVFHEIEDAIGHPYDGNRLDVYGLFTDRPWRVQEIEAVVSGATSGPPSFADGVLVVQHLEVAR